MFLSIITVTKGNKSELFRTIESIDKQNFLDLEHIVVEGSPAEELPYEIELISSARRKFLVGLDNSLYDAMNLGLKVASGEYLLFLNAGDTLLENALATAYAELTSRTRVDLACFKQIFKDSKTGEERSRSHYGSNEPNFRIPFWHQSLLLRREFHKKFLYNLQYKIAADHDLFIRMLSQKPSLFFFESHLTLMYSGGLHEQKRDQANLESLALLINNNIISTRAHVNKCIYFRSLVDAGAFYPNLHGNLISLAHALSKISKKHIRRGLIYANSILGRQIFAVAPHFFLGFVDIDTSKATLPSVRVFALDDLPDDFDFVVCSIDLKASDKQHLEGLFSKMSKEIYFLEDLYGL